MTISARSPRTQITVTGASQTDFDFPFKIFADDDIKVYQTPVGQDPDPGTDILTLGVDYTVAISNGNGGTVTLIVAAPTGDIITIERDLNVRRTTDFIDASDFTAAEFNSQLDQLTAMIAERKSELEERGLLYQVTDELGAGQTTLPKLEANEVWQANGSGNLAAVECITETCSTLRSQLASKTISAPGTDNVGYYDNVLPAGVTVTEFLDDLAPQKDNRSVVKNAADLTKQVKISAANITTGNTRTLTMPDQDVDLGSLTTHLLPRGYIDGGVISPQSGDVDHNINFHTIAASDDLNTFDIIGGLIIKLIDANWAAGSLLGGFPSALVLSPDTWYHCFRIAKTDGTTDAGFDTSVTATNLLADATGYTKYRRVGSILTDGSSNIINFVQRDNIFEWGVPTLDIDINAPVRTATNRIVSIPPDVFVEARLSVFVFDTAINYNSVAVVSPHVSTLPATGGYYHVRSETSGGGTSQVFVLSNETSQIRTFFQQTTATTTLKIVTHGWTDYRGQNKV